VHSGNSYNILVINFFRSFKLIIIIVTSFNSSLLNRFAMYYNNQKSSNYVIKYFQTGTF